MWIFLQFSQVKSHWDLHQVVSDFLHKLVLFLYFDVKYAL